MDIKELVNKLVAEAFSSATPATDESFGEVETKEGELTLSFEGELAIGTEVFVKDAEGNEMAAPNGEYDLEDKKVVVEEGMVAELVEAEAEETEEVEAEEESTEDESFEEVEETFATEDEEEEEMEEEEAEEEMEEEEEEMEEATDKDAEMVKAIVEAVKAELDSLKEKQEEMESKLAKFEQEPAAEPTNVYSPNKKAEVFNKVPMSLKEKHEAKMAQRFNK